MKLVTNTIYTKKVPTLSEMFKAARTQAALEKTASKEEPVVKTASAEVQPQVKVAEEKQETKKEKDEGESSGQLKVEPLHQEGESTGQKPGKLDTQKTDTTASKGEGKKGDKEEAESSGQLEPKKNPNNEPEMPKKDAGAKQQVKTATFTRVAKLTPQEKTFLRDVWSNFWPKAYIDAILGTD